MQQKILERVIKMRKFGGDIKIYHCFSGRTKDPLLLASKLAIKIERHKAQEKKLSPLQSK